ncbi:SGNH/GDSL hydrolase family protein [Paraburkholderia phenoliruptrix]|uniref:SGNH/GDSL hydrolase family protein n=1 Tax=Paraburkholderia phenoliruptrix TaxID=252970 RepID=UPI002858BA5E|nr:SGNH/GDSL hydrolase family protein [Paraburkholderia phenoliruptrix]MDR6389256.1 lysophospholipase L1-like esterase [Paraburkholderia phenoliruptrix]
MLSNPTIIARTHENAIALLGDSRTDMVSDNTSSITQFASNGYFTWTRFLSGQRVYFDDTLNFGVSGDTIAMASARVPNVIASGVSRCIVLIGTNDLAITPIATMISQWTNNIILPLQRGGVQPIVVLEYPRVGISSLALGVKNQFNDYIRRFAQSQHSVPQAVRAILVDPQDYMEDYAGAAGSALSGRLYDGTHPSMIGAYWLGKALADVINQLYPPVRWSCSPADLYDATLNPRGALNANPALLGTAGLLVANTGVTPTGQVATGFKLYRGAGTSTSLTFSGAKENPRTDGPTSGERQRVTVSITGTGSSTETYILQPTTNPSSYIAAGTTVELSCQVEFASAPVNLIGLELQMAEIGPASPRQAVDMVRQTGFQMPSIAVSGMLRTPPFTLQAGVTSISSYIRMVFDASSGTASGDIKVGNFQMRPVL